MAKRFEDARERLTAATTGISALCVRRPVLTIRANYEGATPETMDTQVTRVLEGAASRVPGVKSISSSSESGSSRIVVEFDESSDLNVAASDLRDAVGNAER